MCIWVKNSCSNCLFNQIFIPQRHVYQVNRRVYVVPSIANKSRRWRLRVMYRLRERQAISSLCPLSITLQIVRKKNYERRKMGKRRFGDPKSFSICCLFHHRRIWIKKNYHCYSIICSIISSFYIVIDSERSSRDNYNFVLSSYNLSF